MMRFIIILTALVAGTQARSHRVIRTGVSGSPKQPKCAIADNNDHGGVAPQRFGLYNTPQQNDWLTCWVKERDSNPSCADLAHCERIMIYNEPDLAGLSGAEVAQAWKSYVGRHQECFPKHVVGPALQGSTDHMVQYYKEFFEHCPECDDPNSKYYITDIAMHSYGNNAGQGFSRDQIKGNMIYTHQGSCTLQSETKNRENNNRKILLTEFGGFLNRHNDGHWSDAIEFIFEPPVPTCIEEAFYFNAPGVPGGYAYGNRLYEKNGDNWVRTGVGDKFAEYCS